MRKFIVKETVTLLNYIEAEDEAEALAKLKQRGPLDCDEIDNTKQSIYEVVPDPDE